MGKNVLECVRFSESSTSLGRGPPPPFIDSRRGRLHAQNVSDFVILSSNQGEQLAVPVAEHCEAWSRAWSPSLEAFSHAGNVSLSCGVRGRRGDSCRARCPLRLIGRSSEGVYDGGLVLVDSRTVLEGRFPCPPRVLQRGEYKDLVAQWRAQCRSRPRSAWRVRIAPGMVA